jgi:hypothetical protein
MIATLADLVSALTEDAFVARLRARTPFIQRAAGTDRYPSIIDGNGLLAAVIDGTIPADRLRLTQGGKFLPNALYRHGDAVKPQVIEHVMANAGSIMANGVEPYLPTITTLCTTSPNSLASMSAPASSRRLGRAARSTCIMTMPISPSCRSRGASAGSSMAARRSIRYPG